jgi:ribosomal protein S12 methylthiotransferase
MPELRRTSLPVSPDAAVAASPAASPVVIPPAPATTGAAPKVGFVSLGCPKALVDSEQILTQLRAEGYETANSYDGADLVIVNTCGFIDAAVQESLGAKKDAAGDDIITKVHPKVLAVTGPHAVTEVMESVHFHLPKPHDPFIDLVPDTGVKLTPKHYAYLKISEGCNHRCSFCIIPSMRGDLVSRPIHEVLKEAENLFKAGVKELLVISQDTSAYGVDVKFRTGFWNGRPIKTHMTQLAEALGQMAKEHGAWVRMHYVYPYPHVDQVIPLMGENLVPYLDIPLQHAHPDVLKRMKRPASGEKNLDRILAWRKMNPDLVIRSTFIAGFPGETEEEFEYLLDFLREAQIDRLGCFAYSPVEGATANEIANPVPQAVREERRARVMLLQEEISLKRMQAKVGKKIRVLVDEVGPREAIGRTAADAPEIDGVVHIKRALQPGKAKPAVGEFIEVVVTKADSHDLWATVA